MLKYRYSQTIFRTFMPFCLALLHCQHTWAAGGIVTDGTMGKPITSFTDANVEITEDLGVRPGGGGNLFHSFREFNIKPGQSVTFSDNVTTTNNIITRVTGNSSSDIYGALNVQTGDETNFFMINPNGIIFGEGSAVNVPGSIHLSTADYIKLKDGKIFSAINPQPIANSLSSASPAAFGFLGASHANNGLFKVDSSTLFSEQSVDIVAGNIHILNSFLSLFSFFSDIEMRLIAYRGLGEISLETASQGHLDLPLLTSENRLFGGDILFSGSQIFLTGDGSGRLGIWGGKVVTSNGSTLAITNFSEKNPDSAKGIFLNVNSLKMDDSIISSENQDGEGASGNIAVNASGDINIDNLSQVEVKSTDRNNSGNISLHADKDILVQNASGIKSQISPSALGSKFAKGGKLRLVAGNNIKLLSGGRIENIHLLNQGEIGNVELKADNLIIDNAKNNFSGKTGVFTSTATNVSAGDIDIELRGHLEMLNGSQINSGTSGKGDSGNISVEAENIYISNSSILAQSKLAEPKIENLGDPGNIDLTARKEITLNNGVISISSESKNNNNLAGSISLYFKDNLRLKSARIITESLTGNGGNIVLFGDNIVLETGLIQANSRGIETAGGNLNFNINTMISSGNQLLLGGTKPVENWDADRFGFNVVQSASPNGINGLINITAPVLNLSGTLSSLGLPKFGTGVLNENNCFSNKGTAITNLIHKRIQPLGLNELLY